MIIQMFISAPLLLTIIVPCIVVHVTFVGKSINIILLNLFLTYPSLDPDSRPCFYLLLNNLHL